VETGITDNGLQHLSNVASLKNLYLGSTQVTDAGLEQLKVLPNLAYVYLVETGATDEGVRELERDRPQLAVVR